MYTRKNNWHGTPNFGYRVNDPPHSIKNVPSLNVSVSISLFLEFIPLILNLEYGGVGKAFEETLNRILNTSIQVFCVQT